MFRIIKVSIIIFLLGFISNNTQAQWIQTNGPYGGIVNCFAFGGSTLYAGTNGGVYFSNDSGATWQSCINGLTNLRVLTIAVMGNYVFAGTDGGGLFVSVNNSCNWTPSNAGITTTGIYCFAVNGSTIYAGTSGGVFSSANNGSSWTALNNGLTGTNVRALIFSGVNIFAGTNNGVFLSTNNGSSWSAVNNGINVAQVYSLAASGSYLYTGVGNNIYSSTNNGASWALSYAGFNFIYALAADGTTVFAAIHNGGIIFSANNGASWAPANTGIVGTGEVYSVFINGGITYAGTYCNGVYISFNNGASWVESNTGMLNTHLLSLASNDTVLFAGTNNVSLQKTFDEGDSWIVDTGIPRLTIPSLLVNYGHVIAGTMDGVYRSSNNGNNWAQSSNGICCTNRAIWALASNDSNVFAGRYGGFAYYSSDNGNNWALANSGLGTSVFVHSLATKNDTTFIGTGDGVYSSINNGVSWTNINNGIPGASVYCLLVKGDTVLAGTQTGIYSTTNNGTSWTLSSTGLPWYCFVHSFTATANYIFAGTSCGVYLSYDNGITWVAFNDGLPVVSNSVVTCMAVMGNYIYAGTSNIAVWKRSLSEVVNVYNTTPLLKTWSVFPNPNNGKALIENSSNAKIIINVYNTLGTIVYKTILKEHSKLQLDLSNLTSGIYFISGFDGVTNQYEKLIIE